MIAVASVVLALGILMYVLLVRDKDVPEPQPVSPVQHLEDRKAAIYENLRDLQFEYRVGKLSDEDYQQTKLSLQRELAVVLGEMDATIKRLGLMPGAAPVKRSSNLRTLCPHCGAKFAQALRFCGQCGRAMA